MTLLKRVALYSAGLLVVAIAGFAAYIWITLHWSYSEGERAGFVQKISKRGWVCKTWEGELSMVSLPGAAPEKFYFTVRDDAVAARINQLVGQRAALTYEQHTNVPSSCFGDTEYFITAAKPVQP